VGVAQSASRGAITERQLEVRPIMRQGEATRAVSAGASVDNFHRTFSA
jgi:hypothetical protein